MHINFFLCIWTGQFREFWFFRFLEPTYVCAIYMQHTLNDLTNFRWCPLVHTSMASYNFLPSFWILGSYDSVFLHMALWKYKSQNVAFELHVRPQSEFWLQMLLLNFLLYFKLCFHKRLHWKFEAQILHLNTIFPLWTWEKHFPQNSHVGSHFRNILLRICIMV